MRIASALFFIHSAKKNAIMAMPDGRLSKHLLERTAKN